MTPTRSLNILVTRPQQDAVPLKEMLESKGFGVLIDSMMNIQFRDEAKADLERALSKRVQAILITSANGIRALARMTHRRDIPIITVGESSAFIARRFGFSNILCATDDDPGLAKSDVRNLAHYVKNKCNTAKGILIHIAGTIVAGDLDRILHSVGFVVERVMLYDAQPVERISDEVHAALQAGQVDAVMFYSPRTAEIFMQLLSQNNLLSSTRNLSAICLSDNVREALLRHTKLEEWLNIHVAATPQNDAMLSLLDQVRDA